LHWPLAYSSPCSFGLIHTLCSKKGRHQTHCCKSVNSNQHFKFFFSVRFSSKFAANDLLRIPLHLICVATLPCGILMSEKERQLPTNVVHTHTHPFNGPFSGTTQVSRYRKGKTNLDFTEERDSEWQWHQLGHMQVCISLQTDRHTSTPPLCFLQAGCPSCRPTNSVKALKA